MRRLVIVVAVAVAALGFGALGITSASAKSKNPVTLDGKVNAKGTKDISKSKRATLEVELDDFYFSPTFIKVKPGEKVTLKIKNEGRASHTFTSTALGADKTLSPDSSTRMTITIPSSGKAFEFHCNFHGSMGMKGAFFTAKGATASS
jgi:plastocyanin